MGKATPKNVYFRSETLYRSDGHGDNWCLTWADDDNQITAMCDGDWLSDAHRDEKKRQYHNHLYRIKGDTSNFDRLNSPQGYSIHRYYRHNFDDDKRSICESSLMSMRLNKSLLREEKEAA